MSTMRACEPARQIIARNPALSTHNPLVIIMELQHGWRRRRAVKEVAAYGLTPEFVMSAQEWSFHPPNDNKISNPDTSLMNLHYGKSIPENPPLAVIVMSVDSDLKAIDALASIDTAGVEKIIVNTGSGSLADYIKQDDVLLIESPKKQYPGGTRNIGILHSTAPIISFLASDCLIAPGSLEKRIKAHSDGFTLVSSSLRPSSDSLASWACYIYLHRHRMPEHCRGSGSLFGLSYNRNLFQQYGLFDEAMRVSEDAEFNKLCNDQPFHISSDILTFHRYPETLKGAINDISRRAVREALHRKRSGLRQARSEMFKSLKLLLIVSLSPRMPWKARQASMCLPLLGIAAGIKCIRESKLLSAHKRAHR